MKQITSRDLWGEMEGQTIKRATRDAEGGGIILLENGNYVRYSDAPLSNTDLLFAGLIDKEEYDRREAALWEQERQTRKAERRRRYEELRREFEGEPEQQP